MNWSGTFTEAFLQLAPLMTICLARRCSLAHLGLFCLLFLLDKCLTDYSSGLLPGRWNWGGKAASLGWAIAFVYANPWISREEMGWRIRLDEGSGRFVVHLIVVILAGRLAADLWSSGLRSRYRLETFCYQATMPGLAEEVVYRGIFLTLLSRAVPGRLLGMSYGLLLSSLLFGLIHGLTFDGTAHFSSQRLVMTGALGLTLGLIVERGGSLFPAILLHNLWNLIVFRVGG